MNNKAKILLLILIIAGIGAYAYYQMSKEDGGKSALEEKYISQQQPIELTTSEYEQYYLTREDKLSDKYFQKLLRITGVITGFETAPDGTNSIILNNVECLVLGNYLSGLKVGEEITILAIGGPNALNDRPQIIEIGYFDKFLHF